MELFPCLEKEENTDHLLRGAGLIVSAAVDDTNTLWVSFAQNVVRQFLGKIMVRSFLVQRRSTLNKTLLTVADTKRFVSYKGF